jgi:hypothetical protein
MYVNLQALRSFILFRFFFTKESKFDFQIDFLWLIEENNLKYYGLLKIHYLV